MQLETLFLDAGGVLLFPNFERISAALGRHGVTIATGALAKAELAAKRQLDEEQTFQAMSDQERGRLYFSLMLERAGLSRTPSAEAAIAELHDYHRQHNLWDHVPGDARPALAAFRARGLRLVVVSNANGTLKRLFDRIGLTPTVDLVLDSHEEGVEKPDPRFFQIALERSGARQETTVHVGDLYHVDVVGARAAGIRPVLLDVGDLYAGVDCPRVRSLTALADAMLAGTFGATPNR